MGTLKQRLITIYVSNTCAMLTFLALYWWSRTYHNVEWIGPTLAGIFSFNYLVIMNIKVLLGIED